MGNRYFGSKATSGLCQALIALMPPHSVYIETHLGGGAVMRRKPAALRNIGVDRDAAVLSRFACDYPVERVHGCAHRFLSRFPFDGSELVYSDPPYLRSARKSARRYRHDYADADHEALLALLRGLPCAVMVSGYPSALYDALLADWRSLSLQVMNHAGVVTEKVWFNFAPDRAHWVRFAGRDFTRRQGVKRKAERWARRYRAMPARERMAVLAALMAVDARPPEDGCAG
ncbi:MAG: DNA methylase [Acidobacteriota bacterium]|nr:DNA methylase [Acidobacteriota bacterium]